MDTLHKAPVYFTELFSFGPHYGPKVVDWRSGSCVNFTDLQLYVFRAFGLPCSEEIKMFPIIGMLSLTKMVTLIVAPFWTLLLN